MNKFYEEVMEKDWDKSSWRKKAKHQMPEYKNQEQLQKVRNSLEGLPPLVFAGEVRNLKKDLAKVESGNAFYFKVVIVLKALKNFLQIL